MYCTTNDNKGSLIKFVLYSMIIIVQTIWNIPAKEAIMLDHRVLLNLIQVCYIVHHLYSTRITVIVNNIHKQR